MDGPFPDNSTHAVNDAQPVRYFYLPASLWRCCLYCVLAFSIGIPAVLLFAAIANPGGVPEIVKVVGACLLIAVFSMQFLFARLKVDQHGISRRILWWWDLWPWEAFANGDVQDAGCFHYSLPTRPVWRRTLALAIDDPHAINDLILQVWKRPPPEPVPEAMSLRVKEGLRFFQVELQPSGIVITSNMQSFEYAWSDVVRVTIWRAARYRRDFVEAEIELPETTLKLVARHEINWKGATAEQIAGILRRHSPTKRFRDFVLSRYLIDEPSFGERSISIEEAEARFARDQQQWAPMLRYSNVMTWLIWLLMGAGVVFIGAGFGFIVAFYALMIYGLAWFVRHHVRQTQEHYENECAELEDATADDNDQDVLLDDKPEPQV